MQESQYEEPYHHFVSMDGNIYKMLDWGLGYYGYITRVIHYIDSYKGSIKKMADVGCGDGKLMFEVGKINSNILCYGFDLSARAINFAKAYSYGISNVEFKSEDFSASDIHDYDVITCMEVMEHIDDHSIPGFVKMIRSKISSNGKFIITVPTKVVPLNKKHYRHYDEELLKKQLDGNFEVVHFEWVHDGKTSKFIRFLLVNRFYILRFESLRKILIYLYNKFCLITDSKSGEHLLAICRPI